MMRRIPVGLILLLGVGFIGFGDQILPQPIGRYSLQARTMLDQAMIQMFPSWHSKTDPYARTEKAIDNAEKNK